MSFCKICSMLVDNEWTPDDCPCYCQGEPVPESEDDIHPMMELDFSDPSRDYELDFNPLVAEGWEEEEDV